jgi:hypothetical protein
MRKSPEQSSGALPQTSNSVRLSFRGINHRILERRNHGSPRMICHSDDKFGPFHIRIDFRGNGLNPIASKKTGNESTLRGVFCRGDMTYPTRAPSLQRTCKWILIPAKNMQYLLAHAIEFIPHCTLSIRDTQCRTTVCQRAWVTRHLRMPDVIGKVCVTFPINFQHRIAHRLTSGVTVPHPECIPKEMN